MGVNPAATSTPTHEPIKRAIANGAKLIVVDPFETTMAKEADPWIKPRPATDMALALGMAHVIINEGLYDKDFVDRWTTGFNELKMHMQDYSPQKMSEISWVPAETISEAARFYATSRPAAIQGRNLLCTWSNSRETMEAFKKLDFIATADFFLTPTVEMCDVVLPVAHYLEFDALRQSTDLPFLAQAQQKVCDPGDCKSDTQIYIELSQKLGLGEYFWKDEYDFMKDMLKPAGITLDEFRKVKVLECVRQYRHYEKDGFNTPSGKLEFYSNTLKEAGSDPLPVYREPPETIYSEPELADKFPLILTTRKPAVYRHANFRQIKSLRVQRPDPILNINPETAKKLGIDNGEWVYIENKRGRITHRAEYSESLDPRVVVGDHGWWYPEKCVDEELHGFSESCINTITSNSPPYSPEMGCATFRGTFCRVYKAKP